VEKSQNIISKYHIKMGSTFSYPSIEGNFDERNDIIKYRVTDQNNDDFWDFQSRNQAFEKLSSCLNNFGKICDAGPVQYSIVSIVRFYGEMIPEDEKRHPMNFTWNHDSYHISFRKTDDLGFNCEASVRAYRGSKGKETCKDFYSRKHMSFKNAASETTKLLKTLTF